MICQKHNEQGNLRPKRGNFPTPPYPFHTIHMDFIELNECQGSKYALVIIDVFPKWPEVYPVRKSSVAKSKPLDKSVRETALAEWMAKLLGYCFEQ